MASLVAFADIGDRLAAAPADALSLTVRGPFGGDVGPTADNLVLRALRELGAAAGIGEPRLAVDLDKRLPVAAGLGGGSSDAGAALKLARDLLAPDLDDQALAAVAAQVGADGPMCLHARAAWAEGRGERLSFAPQLPALPALLVNPGVPSPTGAVYRAYDAGPAAGAGRPPPPRAWTIPAVIGWLAEQRNDLQAPAVRLQPAIGEALDEVARLDGARLTRMSGSGATVFALFEDPSRARAAAVDLRRRRPSWWIRPTSLS